MNKEHLRAWNISPHYLLVALLLTAVALAAVVVQTRRAEANSHISYHRASNLLRRRTSRA